MADRRNTRRATRLNAALLLALAASFAGLAVIPATAIGAAARTSAETRVTIADAPPGAGEDCVDDPDAHPGVGLQKCETPFSLATLIPFVAGGIVVLLAIAVGWYLVMRQRASRPFLPDEAVGLGGATGAAGGAAAGAAAASGEWWKCKSCGSTNMVGVARCYKCGAWPR